MNKQSLINFKNLKNEILRNTHQDGQAMAIEAFLEVEQDPEHCCYVKAISSFKPMSFIVAISTYMDEKYRPTVKELVETEGDGILFEINDDTFQYVGIGQFGELVFKKMGSPKLVTDIDLTLTCRRIF